MVFILFILVIKIIRCNIDHKCQNIKSINCTIEQLNTCLLVPGSSLSILLVLFAWMGVCIIIIIFVIIISKYSLKKEEFNIS